MKAKDRKIVPVETPEWPDTDGKVFCRPLTSYGKDAFELTYSDDDGNRTTQNIRARFAVLVACDEDGNLIFDSKDADALGEKSGVVMERLWFVGRNESAMTSESVVELEKN